MEKHGVVNGEGEETTTTKTAKTSCGCGVRRCGSDPLSKAAEAVAEKTKDETENATAK